MKTYKNLIAFAEAINSAVTLSSEEVTIIKEGLDTLEWLIDHLMVASGLLELRIAPPTNKRWVGWTHNGIPVIDKDFDKHAEIIRRIKYDK